MIDANSSGLDRRTNQRRLHANQVSSIKSALGAAVTRGWNFSIGLVFLVD